MKKFSAIDTLVGAFASDGSEVVKVFARKDVNSMIARALEIEERGYSDEFVELLKKLKEFGDVHVIVEDDGHARAVSHLGLRYEIGPGAEQVLSLREKIPELAVEGGFIDSAEDFVKFVHEISILVTRKKLRKYAQKRDLLAIQAIRAIDDIDKTINLFSSRLREWYSIHFPELDDLVPDHKTYARIVAEIGSRDNLSEEALREIGLSEGKAKRIVEVAKKSIGADLSDFDIEQMKALASLILELYRMRDELTEYVGMVMREVAPNITELVGPLLGARLLSLAGSLENLAKMPASTIQVLGAEKALFRALRTGGRPPKHGIIFQFKYIHSSPKWQRGKIARALATKLAIAAKADYFTGRFIGKELKESLMKRIEEIKEKYPKPPKRAREVRPRPGPRRWGRRGKRKKGRRGKR